MALEFQFVEIKNLSEDTTIFSKQTKKKIELVTAEPDQIIFYIEDPKIIVGSRLSIEGLLKLKKGLRLEVIGKVVTAKPVGKGLEITVKFQQYEKNDWQKVLNAVSNNQKRVQKIFKSFQEGNE